MNRNHVIEVTDAALRRAAPDLDWTEVPEEGLPKYALHVYIQGEPELVIRRDNLLALRSRAYSIANDGAWLDDEYWPAHSIHHCWLETVGHDMTVKYEGPSPNYDRDEDDGA